MVMEKSWNMKNWPNVMAFCDQSWYFTNFAPKLYQIYIFFSYTKKLSSDLQSLQFLTFSTKCRTCKIGKQDGHGKSRNGHGKVMERYFVKSVGTLAFVKVTNRVVPDITDKLLSGRLLNFNTHCQPLSMSRDRSFITRRGGAK